MNSDALPYTLRQSRMSERDLRIFDQFENSPDHLPPRNPEMLHTGLIITIQSECE